MARVDPLDTAPAAVLWPAPKRVQRIRRSAAHPQTAVIGRAVLALRTAWRALVWRLMLRFGRLTRPLGHGGHGPNDARPEPLRRDADIMPFPSRTYSPLCAANDAAKPGEPYAPAPRPVSDPVLAQPEAAPQTEACADVSGTPLHVLVVDDNAVNRKVMGAILQSVEAVVTFAENGEEAVRFAQIQHIDLIFMDIRMPIMDGVDATRRIRAWEGQAGRTPTPIIAVTANNLDEHRDEYLAAGIDECLHKPVKAQQLKAIVEEVADQRTAPADTDRHSRPA